MPHAAAAAAAAASQAGRRRRRRRTAYPRGAVAAGHRLAAVRATSPVGRASVGSGRRSLHLYAQFKWHTQRRGARPARIGGAPESVHRPSGGGGGTGDRSRNLPGPARPGRRREGGGRADGRREKFNHETFMRRRVLTIRRQIAKRRRSEIIRNLQLTGAGRGRAA